MTMLYNLLVSLVYSYKCLFYIFKLLPFLQSCLEQAPTDVGIGHTQLCYTTTTTYCVTL